MGKSKVETIINRPNGGWVILVVNNNGWRKSDTTRARVDRTKTERAGISFQARNPRIRELLKAEKTAAGQDRGGAPVTRDRDT